MSGNSLASSGLREVLSIRIDAARRLAPALRRVDVSDMGSWQAVVEGALGAGVAEVSVIQETGCSRSTLQRWRAGHVAPGPGARAVIRDRLADMVEAWADEAESSLAADVPDEAGVLAL